MLKKAGPFKYKKLKALPADSDITNTRFYILTDQGNFWCPPFKEMWQTFPEEMEQCLQILNVFAVRLDLDIATRCFTESVDLDIGELIGFAFNVPTLSWKQPERSPRSESNASIRRSSGQPGPKLRWVYGQDGALAIRGMVRDFGSPDDSQLRHSVVKLLPQARSNDKALPVRHNTDEAPDPRG